ncbi:MAG: hypothetical protein B6226_05135 [Candidatus Cloacimonetes bacterium 4572_65]|nr:MAG: hypothetical protein B6226_05135 [Candidatus Cloacimonetes bacterium 4572_65]
MKFYRTSICLLIAVIMMFSFGCSNDDTNSNVNETVNWENIEVVDDFDFSTSANIEVEINVFNGNNTPVVAIPFTVYSDDPTNGGELLFKGATNQDGSMKIDLVVKATLRKVFVVGYMSSIEIPITNNSATFTFGTGQNSPARNSKVAVTNRDSEVEYVLPYNNDGVPIGMEFDNVDSGFLTRINTSLPERSPVPRHHPEFLEDGNQLNVVFIDALADVWVTFVHEGAGYRNALAYYTYQAGNAPQTADDIDTLKVIFPNVSFVGSGGGLVTGDKVYLGRFEPGTVIGWSLFTEGWKGSTNGAEVTTNTWYSNYDFNHTGLQQSILLYDGVTQSLVFAFEDLVFDNGDDDFNDAVFYATIDPIESVDLTGVLPIDGGADSDGDGIDDVDDDFPFDVERAFQNNTTIEYSLAFEDLWPRKGDYDFNDMVVDYNIFYHTSSTNLVKNVVAEFQLKAVGASYRNGFAVQFPFNSNNIESMTIVDGSDDLTYSNVVSDVNFAPVLESGEKAVIVFFEETKDLIPQAYGSFINTVAGDPFITPARIALDIKLTNAEDMTTWLWNAPFNPFIFVNRERSHEIHLVDYPPTPQADLSLFGTGQDDSNIALNRYYRTVNNHPWAIHIAGDWDYPYEKTQTPSAFTKFKEWAESTGMNYQDWFEDIEGYRVEERIYDNPE